MAAKPTCGDCHRPSHSIQMLTDNPEARAELHMQGYEICGKCHAEEWDSYSDYYHGAAYRRGAPDAPSCWDCHGFHTDSAVRQSRVSGQRGATSKTPADRMDAIKIRTIEYLEYAGLVHRRDEVRAENPFYKFMNQTRDTIQGVFGTIRSWFT